LPGSGMKWDADAPVCGMRLEGNSLTGGASHTYAQINEANLSMPPPHTPLTHAAYICRVFSNSLMPWLKIEYIHALHSMEKISHR
jgi:hypothetical protein